MNHTISHPAGSHHRSILVLLLLLVLAVGLPHLAEAAAAAPRVQSRESATASQQIDTSLFIRVAKDKFHFEDGLQRRFYPYGAFYCDERHPGTDPLAYWRYFDKQHIDEDFKLAKSLGCNTLRLLFMGTVTTLSNGQRSVLTAEDIDKIDYLLAAAKANGLRLYAAPRVEGSMQQITQDQALWLQLFRKLGQRYRNNPTIFCWELDAEPVTLVGYPGDKELWQKWLMTKYFRVSAIAKAWGVADANQTDWMESAWTLMTNALQHSSGIDARRNQKTELWYLDKLNRPGNQMMFDWQLFRNELYTQKIGRLSKVLRDNDPNHLQALDFTLYSFPLVRNPGAPGWGGPYGYSGSDIPALSKLVDFFGVHAYPYYVPPFTTEWAESLTKDPKIFQRELRFVETYIRYFRANSGLPVVLSENGWHGGDGDWQNNTEQDQVRWNLALVEATKDCAVGWLNWTLRDIPTHDQGITAHSGLVGAVIAVKPDTENTNPLSDYLYNGELPVDQQNKMKAWGSVFKSLVQKAYTDPSYKFIPGKQLVFDKRQLYTGTSTDVDKLLKQCLQYENCDVIVK